MDSGSALQVAGREGGSVKGGMIFVAFDVLRDSTRPKVAATFSVAGVFSFQDESSQFEGSGWHSRLFRKRLFQPRFFNV